MMADDFDALAKGLKDKYGLEFAEVIRDTHANTAMRVVSLVSESLELAIRSKLLAEGRTVSDRMFKGDGKYSTLERRIDGAHALGLIDDWVRDDAHLMRRARNKFAHEKDRLHFDSGRSSLCFSR